MLKHPNANSLSKMKKSVKLRKSSKIQGITIRACARVLGSVIGTESECKKFLEFQQNQQIKILKKKYRKSLKPPPKTIAVLKELTKNFILT